MTKRSKFESIQDRQGIIEKTEEQMPAILAIEIKIVLKVSLIALPSKSNLNSYKKFYNAPQTCGVLQQPNHRDHANCITRSWRATDHYKWVEHQVPKIGLFYVDEKQIYLPKSPYIASTQLSHACKTWLAGAWSLYVY